MQDLLDIFKALSDETRLRILKLLERDELCVCDIVAALGMSQPKVSFHLNVLKEAGLIKDRKEGRWIHYRLDETDFFRRFLLLSVLEKTTGGSRFGRISRDSMNFCKETQTRKSSVSIDKRKCCGSNS